jgi:hypothetical protein
MHSLFPDVRHLYKLAAMGISEVLEKENLGRFLVEFAMAGFSAPDIISLTLFFIENALRIFREFSLQKTGNKL